jgi:hypothetical protein
MKIVTNQNYLSDVSNEQKVIRCTEKLAQIFGLNEQNAKVYTALSGENRVLKKQLEDYHSQYNTLEKKVKKLKRDVRSLKIELENLDEYVDRKTMVNLIHEIVPLLIGKKGPKGTIYKSSFYSSDSSEESDLVEIIEVREKKAVSHKQ